MAQAASDARWALRNRWTIVVKVSGHPEATGLGDETKPVGSPADDPPVRGSGHDRGVDPDGLDLELVENRSSSVTADQNEPVVRAPLQLVGNVGGELGGDIGGVGGVGTLWRAGGSVRRDAS